MRHRTLTVLTLIFTLMMTPLAQAASHDRDGRGAKGHGHGHSQQKHDRKKHHAQQRRQQSHRAHRQQQRHFQHQRHQQQRRQYHRSAASHHWRRGDHVPRSYYGNQRYWVSDWRGHHLSRPPHGHRWLNIDGRYVLAAVAGGAITAIILGR